MPGRACAALGLLLASACTTDGAVDAGVMLLVTVQSAPVTPAPRTVLTTLQVDGGPPKDGVYNASLPALSADGRFVTQRSGSPLVPGVAAFNIFLRDLTLGTTELVSAGLDGGPGEGDSELSDVSDDGCVVAFESASSALVPGDTNGLFDVFVKNRCASPPTLTRVSLDALGGQLSQGSHAPSLSRDGRFLAYVNGALGVVRLDLQTGAMQALTGTKATGDQPAISDDGARVAFWSFLPLVDADTDGVWDIYLWDQTAGLSLVSTSSTGALRNQGTESASRVVQPAISGDGRFVSFATTSDNLVASDTNGASDVFVKDTSTGALTRVSVTAAGVEGDGDSPSEQGGRAALSKDGTWVVFETAAKNLSAGAGHRVVRVNRVTLKSQVVDGASTGSAGNRPAVSHDARGRFVAFFAPAALDSRFDATGLFRWDAHAPVLVSASLDAVSDAQVTLAASVVNVANADFFGGTLPLPTYTWSQLDGPTAVTFNNPHGTSPTGMLAAGVYHFRVQASDGVDTGAATVTVTAQ